MTEASGIEQTDAIELGDLERVEHEPERVEASVDDLDAGEQGEA